MLSDHDVIAEIGDVIASMTPEWQTLSLSQALIKLTAPGIPDIYQGSELWDLRLVDPDNRTAVDFEARRTLLHDVMHSGGGDFMSRLADAGPKLRLIASALAVRARHPEAFDVGGGYRRVAATGARAEHAICFARTGAGEQPVTVTIAFRWPLLLRPGWLDTVVQLPAGSWHDSLTGREVAGGQRRLETLLDAAPVALLERA
jgi:(1->4)-alpha-D-glucan 1-alpha-D-glucosylmutase